VQPFAIGSEFCQVTTVLSHKQGGRLESSSRFKLPGELKDFGSARTYMCRYALNSLLVLDGDADADDLPEPQQLKSAAQPEPRRQAPPQAVQKAAQQKAREPEPTTSAEGPSCSRETTADIMAEGARLKLKGPALADNCKAVLGVTPDRLELAGGEALAQKWLASLRGMSP
jgi:hypothetical protein